MSYTKFPNWIIDDIMPLCSPNEWKIVCAITRNTFGWGKSKDKISYTQFEAMTGIKHRKTISDCIQSLIDAGIIKRSKSGRQMLSYELVPVQKVNQFNNGTSSENEPVIAKTSSKNEPELVQKMNTQKKKESLNKILLWAAFFEGMTGFTPPHESSMYFVDNWETPLSAIINQSGSDAEIEERITYGVNSMREKGYTIKSPKSILTFALNHNGIDKNEIVKQSEDGGIYV